MGLSKRASGSYKTHRIDRGTQGFISEKISRSSDAYVLCNEQNMHALILLGTESLSIGLNCACNNTDRSTTDHPTYM